MLKFSLVFVAFLGITFGNDITCPPEGQHFYPHPTRCAKFIECNDGVLAEQECFGDLTFNPVVGFCDFPENFECEDLPDTVPEGPVGTCPIQNGALVDFLVDATRCNVFYMCNWGTPIQMECPEGLHFNPTKNVCDYPYRAGCLSYLKL
ncbi:peritrophin-1-like [Onthophagus taurus]|uniref:peritrophin-1-like n=1 Tax=Onthophagus taurus TaxID=166361 RepID=UPI0039BDDF42